MGLSVLTSLTDSKTVGGNCKKAFSKILQVTMLDSRAFDMAVEEGYIQRTVDGHLEWMLGSSTLLAYFLGRLFAGDYSKYSRGKGGMLWMRGGRTFPATELQQLFGQKTLRKLRQNRDGCLLPQHFELIDELFSMK